MWFLFVTVCIGVQCKEFAVDQQFRTKQHCEKAKAEAEYKMAKRHSEWANYDSKVAVCRERVQ